MLDEAFNVDGESWLNGQFHNLTDELIHLKPSEWAEKNRYLPAVVTPKPGHFRFAVAPYLKEILDCGDPYFPVNEIDFMKGAQVCATVGILENYIGYSIEHLKNSPMMFLTADKGLAKERLDEYIIPMIQFSDLDRLIQSNDESSNRKTGIRELKLSWFGGGYCNFLGALNAAKLRSGSIKILLEDEVDGYPLKVGKDGDPQKLAEARTKAFSATKKIFRTSTPLIKGNSRIERGFKAGDQRYYYVPCVKCGTMQVLKFSGVCKETGHTYGLQWGYESNGALDFESVRYICISPDCGHSHVNEDKTSMLANGHWLATAKPANPRHRSYHLNALYSPVDFYSWPEIVNDWLAAWDIEQERPKDNGLLQEFYNNNLGETFEITGKQLTYANVSPHRRVSYQYGEINNKYVEEVTGSKILLLTCAVDVQENYLSVAVFGWARWSRAFLINYIEIEGPTDDLDSMFSPWVKLAEFMRDAVYISDDQREYRIAITLVDSGYRTSTVYDFCGNFENGVYPIKGDSAAKKKGLVKEFSSMNTAGGIQGFLIWVNHYKDRWYSALKREWNNVGEMPKTFFSAPMDITEKQLKELTAERKRLLIDPVTQKVVGSEWHRTGDNELWDLLNYNNAALDITAYDLCRNVYELESVNWPAFWDFIEQNGSYYTTVTEVTDPVSE